MTQASTIKQNIAPSNRLRSSVIKMPKKATYSPASVAVKSKARFKPPNMKFAVRNSILSRIKSLTKRSYKKMTSSV